MKFFFLLFSLFALSLEIMRALRVLSAPAAAPEKPIEVCKQVGEANWFE